MAVLKRKAVELPEYAINDMPEIRAIDGRLEALRAETFEIDYRIGELEEPRNSLTLRQEAALLLDGAELPPEQRIDNVEITKLKRQRHRLEMAQTILLEQREATKAKLREQYAPAFRQMEAGHAARIDAAIDQLLAAVRDEQQTFEQHENWQVFGRTVPRALFRHGWGDEWDHAVFNNEPSRFRKECREAGLLPVGDV